SFAQQRLWFLDRLEPGSVLYNMPARVALEPPPGEGLDAPALARALAAIVRRHESLRTTFRRGEEGRPVQVVRAKAVQELPVLDLTALPAAAARREAARQARIEGGTPFALDRGPLVRFRLLRLPGEDAPEHSLLFTAHHTVSDGWSTDLFLGELAALYRAFREERPSPLPELPVQYGDFALWQQEWLGREALQALLEFWRGALAGAPRLLELPADRPRPPSPSGRGSRARLAFAPGLTGAVHALARRAGATPFMVLLAGWVALLSRRSGAADVAVGVPVAGRTHSELEPLIGFFANTVVVRAGLGGRPAFGEVLGRVRDAALAAYAHQDLPFEKLVEELRPERNLAHHPLFQVLFAFQNTVPLEAPEPERARSELRARLLPSYNDTARFDLALNLWEHEGRLVGYLEHSADLFDGATAARMVRELEMLLAGALASPEARVDALPVLGAAERHALLVESADTAAPFPEGATLGELATAQAARTPDATALVFRDRWVSYGELSRRTAALARRLRALGVGPGAVVAVCAERSLEMVLALHAVVRAGAAYLPLDPNLPAERLAFLLVDAGARVLLTQAHLAAGA
ncbi:MAG TPA: condensation domain-containing protein, partial [Thermoanaerobaculia bacterium]|nr:condensation domain-containing protein [Thermoanaerobaculia bacterium]